MENRSKIARILVAAILIATWCGPRQIWAAVLKVPDGFTIEQVAGPDQVRFPMFATLDDRGRLYVAESSGGDLYAELAEQRRNCRIRLLEDHDGDGRYEISHAFADRLVFPMGLAWRDGKLYVADPPDLLTLEDLDGDDRADRRSVILTGFGHVDNGSLHGLTFGPDGMLYMTMGTPDGWKLRRADGSILQGVSGALFRCRPDGSNVQVVARGFVNLVEIAFTPGGEIIGTDNWWQDPNEPGSDGMRDALVHLVEGGLYPYVPDSGTPLPITGVRLPYMELQPAVAFSGLCIGGGEVFTAQHNARKVGRHVLLPRGTSYTTQPHDFVTTDDPDFHPSDVLEDRDGSLLVLDTGSWYVHHCPTGVIRHSPATGGIYRVRSTAARSAPKPRDAVSLSFQMAGLLQQLREGTPNVRLAAAEALAHAGDRSALPEIWAALTRVEDDPSGFLEHALVHAAHRIADTASLQGALDHAHARVRKAALVLLDQPPRPAGSLKAETVIRFTADPDESLRHAALETLARHPQWADHALELMGGWFSKPSLSPEELAALRGCMIAFAHSRSVQELVHTAIINAKDDVPSGRRVLALQAVAQANLPDFPPAWADAIGQAIESHEPEVRIQAVRTAAALGRPELDSAMDQLADVEAELPAIRLEAIRASISRRGTLNDSRFDFLLTQLRDAAPLPRLTTAEILRHCELSDAQSMKLLETAARESVVTPELIVGAFRRSLPDPVAKGVLEYLRASVSRGVHPAQADVSALMDYLPVSVRGEAQPLLDQLRVLKAARSQRLAELEPLLMDGDPRRGGKLFISKATCFTCHRVGGQGGAIGPDLTKIGAIRSGPDLLESLVFPAATIAQGYDYFTATTTDGRAYAGVVRDRTADGLTIRDAAGGEVRLRTQQIKSLERLPISLMPEGLDRMLSTDELRDLLAYLQGLR